MPERLASHLRTEGWRPIAANIKISNVTRIVSMFGGEALYGRDLSVPLRELIQNASDAVRARRALEPPISSFKGEIVISLSEGKNHDVEGFWLCVEDDGIGMSENTLVGPLLDFGATFWDSEFLQDEFPGLAAKNLRQTGRFGIGFFSVFMMTDRVIVDSCRYDRGMETQRSLSFEHGLSLRPLLLDKPMLPLSAATCTRVGLFLTRKALDELLHPKNDGIPVEVTLKQLVGRLCPTLDCDVLVVDRDKGRSLAHQRAWLEEDPFEWLCQIILPEASLGPDEDKAKRRAELKRYASFVTPVRSGSRVIGRAAIGSTASRGLVSSGGLLSTAGDSFWYDFAEGYVGCIDREPPGPRRSGGFWNDSNLPRDLNISGWASEQAVLLAGSDLDREERLKAASLIAHFQGDPTPLAAARLNWNWLDLPEIIDFLLAHNEIFFIAKQVNADEDSAWILEEAPHRVRRLVSFPISAGEVGSVREVDELLLDPWIADLPRSYPYLYDGIYYVVPSAAIPASNSFLDCLIRFARTRGVEIDIECRKDVIIGRRRTGEKLVPERGSIVRVWSVRPALC